MTFETGTITTIAIFLAGVIFKLGSVNSDVESLKLWRGSVRLDMHEISDKIDDLSQKIVHLTALIEERTERRTDKRPA